MNKNRQAFCESIVKSATRFLSEMMDTQISLLGVQKGDVLIVPESHSKMKDEKFPFCNNVRMILDGKGAKGTARQVRIEDFNFFCDENTRIMNVMGVVLNKDGTWAKVQTLTGSIRWDKDGNLDLFD